jgi:hypothetical protein
MSRPWRTLFSPRSKGSRGSEPPRRTSWRPCRSSCRTAWAVLHARWSAKPEKLDHLNDPLLLRDAVGEQHRPLAEELDRGLVECSPSAPWAATAWLSASNAMARSRRPASASEATEARIASVLTRKGSITPAAADPGQPTHPQATWRPLGPARAVRGAGPPSGPPNQARYARPARADTSPAQRLPARRSPGCRPPPWSRQPAPVGTARHLPAAERGQGGKDATPTGLQVHAGGGPPILTERLSRAHRLFLVRNRAGATIR